MIAPGSVIGFALVFLGAAWLGSLAAAALTMAFGRRLRAFGPRAEQAAAATALAVPPVLALILTLSIALLARRFDHCLAHLHHLHLCPEHGGHWSGVAWAVAAVAAAVAAFSVGLLRRTVAALTGARALARLRRVARSVDFDGQRVRVVESARPFCFVAGRWGGEIYVSTAALARLADAERTAVFAHEATHVRGKHLLVRRVLDRLAFVGAPGFAQWLLRRWDAATERACDRAAARAVGDATIVATALVSMARLAGPPAPGLAFPATGRLLDQRVESLLAPEGADRGAASRIRRGAIALCVIFTALVIALAEPLHHLIETLLAAF